MKALTIRFSQRAPWRALAAAADAKKTVRLVKVLTQSADHSILPAIPETEYLKGFLLQVVEG